MRSKRPNLTTNSDQFTKLRGDGRAETETSGGENKDDQSGHVATEGYPASGTGELSSTQKPGKPGISAGSPFVWLALVLLISGLLALLPVGLGFVASDLAQPLVVFAIVSVLGSVFFQMRAFSPLRGFPRFDDPHRAQVGAALVGAVHEHVAVPRAMVLVTDANHKIVDVNSQFETAIGYSARELAGLDLAKLVVEGAQGAWSTTISTAVVEKRISHGDGGLLGKAGNIVRAGGTAVPVRDETGKIDRVVMVMADLSAYSNLESDTCLRSLLDELDHAIYVYDAETLSVGYLNEPALKKTELTLENILGQPVYQANSALSEMFIRRHVEPLREGREDVVCDTMSPEYPFEAVTRRTLSRKGREAYVSVLRNISDRKQLENNSMGSVSEISHELRAPLTSIKGALRLLQSGATGEMTPDAVMIVDIACRNTERLLSTVNNILDLQKFQMGKMDFDREPIDLIAFLNESLAMNAGYGDEHEVAFELIAPPDRAFVKGNEERLHQVMTNLLSNAAKYSPPGGTARVCLHDEGRFWRVCVQDDGPGLPETARDTIFESFVQHAPEDGKSRAGTGLGLSITREIVQLHGGKLDLESVVGEGSTFFFDLPKLETDPGSGSQAVRLEGPGHRSD